VLGVFQQRRGEAHLLADLVAALLQALQHGRQVGVAQALVEGAVAGEEDGRAGPVAEAVVQGGGVAADLAGLQPGVVHFLAGQQRQDHRHQHQEQPHGEPVTASAGPAARDHRVQAVRRQPGR